MSLLPGVNVSGAEFSPATLPGTNDVDYHHTTGQAAWDQVAARLGAGSLGRYPFLWERLQRDLAGPLDAGESTLITAALDAAAAAGVDVILDAHNYGRYQPKYRNAVIVQTTLDGATASSIASNGFSHVVIPAYWDRIKTGGTGSAVNGTELQNLKDEVDAADGAGLDVILEPTLHFPPTAVKTAVPKLKQQDGTEWTGGIGDDIRDWVWSQVGRDAVEDFLDDLFVGLGASYQAKVDSVRVGGMNFGELSFPSGGTDADPDWWGYSAPAQTGTGLAAGATVCPVTAHAPSLGTAWTANDIAFHDWYLGSVSTWLLWLIDRVRDHVSVPIHVLHPGFGLRDNYDPTGPETFKAEGYRRQSADAVDWAGQMDAYKARADVWPWSTWGDGADPFPGGTVDSDRAAYKSLWDKAAARTRDGIPLTVGAWAENTGIQQTGNSITTDIDNFYNVRARPYGYTNLTVYRWQDLTAGAGEGLTAVAPYLAATRPQMVVGDGDLTGELLADLWRRIAVQWGAHPAIVGWGVMNEPHDLPDATPAGFVSEATVNTYDGGAGPGRGGSGASFDASKTGTGEDVIGGDAVDLTGRTHASVWVRVDSGSDTTTARLGVRDASFSNQNISGDVAIPADGDWHQVYGPIPVAQQGVGGGVAHRNFTLFVGGGAGAKTVYVDDLEAGSESAGVTGLEYWETATQVVLDAIRAAEPGTPRTTLIPLGNWSGAQDADTTHPGGPWIVGGAPIRYEAHHYFDRDNSGDYPDTYAAEITDAQGRGYTAGANVDALHTRVRAEVAVFTAWLAGADGLIGEFGWPWDADAAAWNALAVVWLADVDAAGLWATQWAAGEWWGAYNLGVYVDADLATVRGSSAPIEAYQSVQSVDVGADVTVAQGAAQIVRAVTSSGFAGTPTLVADQSDGSPLPSGVSFVDNANGTGALTLNHTTVGSWVLRVTGDAAVAYGPRVTPGVAGADANPAAGGLTVTRLAGGTYNNYSVPANRLVLPEVGASVTLTGQTSFGAGSRLYGVTLNSQGASWAALIDGANVTVEQCNFAGDPGIEHIRARRLGVLIKACRFTGSPTNHDIKVDGRTTQTGAGVISDCEFASTPLEDHIQCDGTEAASTVEHNAFTAKATEDAIDVKNGATVTVRNHDFTSAGFNGEALLMQNGGPGSNVAEDNRFGSGCFHSFGAHPEDTSVTGVSRRNIYLAGSTLRVRRSQGVEVHDCEFTSATFRLGTSTANDYPQSLDIHDNDFADLTIQVSNASSTTITANNTYAGTTTGTFPSGNN